tara:strand:- start:148 stop:630 length:483 start_codon:yes stop_codon:yes gene_type:complete
MPTHTQGIVEIKGTPSSRSKGTRDDATLRAAFAGSPIYNEELTDEAVRADFEMRCMTGQINDEGHTFGTFDVDFSGAPDMTEVETGGGGLPASPYSPNVTSPGPGSTSPEDMPEAPEGYNSVPSDTPFVGTGALENPKATSTRQASGRLGSYQLGKSIGS